MKFQELVERVGDRPCFLVQDLMVEPEQRQNLRIQLGRWCKSGKITKVRRGIYSLNAPWRKGAPSGGADFFDNIEAGSWISAEAALSYYGVIPETTFRTTVYGVNIKEREEYFELETGIRAILFRSAPREHAFGCHYVGFGRVNTTYYLFAEPEKALLDWACGFKYCLNPDWLQELRLDYLLLDKDKLIRYAHRFLDKRMVPFANMVGINIDEEKAWDAEHGQVWS